MKALPFAKIVPGGNPTILIPALSLAPEQLPQISQKLMHPNHVGAEQVGSLSLLGHAFSRADHASFLAGHASFPSGHASFLAGHASSLPHLQMMGGEFCVNATRASASLLANAGLLASNEHGCQAGYMSVSGSPDPILVATAPTGALLAATVRLLQEHKRPEGHELQGPALPPSFTPCSPAKTGWPDSIPSPNLHAAARLTCPVNQSTFEYLDENTVLVHLPGISHLLIPTSSGNMPEPNQCAHLAARYRNDNGLDNLPASGTIWYEKTPEGFAILPAVYVKDTDSLCIETACGSASLALALQCCIASERYENTPESSYAIRQPSGQTLTVTITKHSAHTCHAWVTGPTHIVALGMTYVGLNT